MIIVWLDLVRDIWLYLLLDCIVRAIVVSLSLETNHWEILDLWLYNFTVRVIELNFLILLVEKETGGVSCIIIYRVFHDSMRKIGRGWLLDTIYWDIEKDIWANVTRAYIWRQNMSIKWYSKTWSLTNSKWISNI